MFFSGDDNTGGRVAKYFQGELYFGTVGERRTGAVLAPLANGIKVWQAVWNVGYDDGDFEHLSRLEIVAAMRTYRQHRHLDTRNIPIVAPAIAASNSSHETDREDTEADLFMGSGMMSTGTQFLDSRYNLLELLTPTATQNRLSYLVELVLDKANKKISNEALKVRLRKDVAAFGAIDMPTDIRAIGRYLGARTIAEITRHMCGNKECSYCWIGVVCPSKYDSRDVCPDCDTPRYKLKGGKLSP